MNILPEDELEHLRARLRAQQKEKLSRPVLFQTTIPAVLRPADVRQLLMYALEGGCAQGIKPEWCSLVRWQKISQILVVAVDNMTRDDWDRESSVHTKLKSFLDVWGPLEPQDEKHISKCLLEYPVSLRRLGKMGRGTKEEQLSQGECILRSSYTFLGAQKPRADLSVVSVSSEIRLNNLMVFFIMYRLFIASVQGSFPNFAPSLSGLFWLGLSV